MKYLHGKNHQKALCLFECFGLITTPKSEGQNQTETPKKGIMQLNHAFSSVVQLLIDFHFPRILIHRGYKTHTSIYFHTLHNCWFDILAIYFFIRFSMSKAFVIIMSQKNINSMWNYTIHFIRNSRLDKKYLNI